MMQADPILEARDLSKRYGGLLALQRCSFRLQGSGIWALVGPNGAGKSTLLRLLAGQCKPSLGTVQFDGQAPFRQIAVARQLGWCPSAEALYEEATPLEFVACMARWSGMPSGLAKQRAAEELEALDLLPVMHRRLRELSRGMRQRVKVAQAVVHRPRLLLLDEPFAALDAAARDRVASVVRARAEAGAMVVVSTHLLDEVAQLSDRLLMMVGGRLVAQGSQRDLQRLLAAHAGRFQVAVDQPRRLAQALVTQASVRGVRVIDGQTLEVEADDLPSAYAQLTQCLLADDHGFRALVSEEAHLPTLFHRLLQSQQRQPAAAEP